MFVVDDSQLGFMNENPPSIMIDDEDSVDDRRMHTITNHNIMLSPL